MRYYELMETDFGNYLYHVTSPNNLKDISTKGLVPSEPSVGDWWPEYDEEIEELEDDDDFPEEATEARLFAWESLEDAENYSTSLTINDDDQNIILRFPRDGEWYDGDSEVGRFVFSTSAVPAEKIDLKTKNGWKKLKDIRDGD